MSDLTTTPLVRFIVVLGACLLLLAASVASAAAQTGAPFDTAVFQRATYMIPMRDGARLHTLVYTPKQMAGPLPILMTRTPYFADRYYRAGLTAAGADDGYIFVFQDLRGRSGSEGTFVMDRPPLTVEQRKNPTAIDEVTDAYDTIDWLVKHVPNNNGRVGCTVRRTTDGWR